MSDCEREIRGFEDEFRREGCGCELEESREVRNSEFEERTGEFNSRRGCRCLANDIERLIRDIRRDTKELECKFNRLEERGCIRSLNNEDNGCNCCNHCNRCNRCSRCDV